MLKKLLGIVAITALLSGCSAVTPKSEFVSVAYGLPSDCEIKELVSLDPSYEALDQTEAGKKNVRNCVVGTPNSDVGIFFEFKAEQQDIWGYEVAHGLKDEKYSKFDSGIADVETWRKQEGSEEAGTSCSIHGHIGGVTFYIAEPWAECDDKWNKELVGYVVKHAEVASR